MIKYLFDTNIIIYHLNGETTAIDWLKLHRNELDFCKHSRGTSAYIHAVKKNAVSFIPAGEKSGGSQSWDHDPSHAHRAPSVIESALRIRKTSHKQQYIVKLSSLLSSVCGYIRAGQQNIYHARESMELSRIIDHDFGYLYTRFNHFLCSYVTHI